MTTQRTSQRVLHTLVAVAWCVGSLSGAGDRNSPDRGAVRERPELRAAPNEEAPVVSLLSPAAPFVISGAERGWLEVEQGETRGWLAASRLPLAEPSPVVFCLERKRHRWLEWGWPQQPQSGGGLLPVDPDEIAADVEYIEKMKDPFYRHRYYQFYREWGPVFYRRTQVFYVRGVRLFRWCGGDLELRLVKRRLFYKTIFGPLWPEDLIRAVIRSRPGIWGNESIFGKGREYYLELAWNF
ncbi:MAG: hypothetical protein Kow00109_04600 [Acidobacteriota bacterium]